MILFYSFFRSQKFQGLKNIETMRHFEKEGNVLTLRDTMHYAPCDIPTVLMGSWARLPFSLLFQFNSTSDSDSEQSLSAAPLPAWKSLSVCSEIGVKYFSDSQLQQCLEENRRYLIYGTDYLQ